MTLSFKNLVLPRQRSRRVLTTTLLALGIGWGIASETKASLIINEVFNSNKRSEEWIEFLVTTDITLSALDSIWFGDSNSATTKIGGSSRFESSEIISNFSYFTSASDIVRAGTIIVVGGDDISSDFIYNPNPNHPGDVGSWNFTLSGGIGFNTTSPVNLNSSSGTVWIASAQPANDTDTSNFISAIAYLDATSATGGGAIADYVTTQSATNSAFQTIHRGSGGGYDGSFSNNTSFKNASGSGVDFANSEGSASLGIANGSFNSTYIGTLRAVPEPGTFLPLSLLVLGGLYLRFKKRLAPAPSPERETL